MTRQTGLTLVELMVVVAVMAVIAAIAYPLYTTQTQKSRRADAKIALETVALAQERAYTLGGRYYLIGASTLQAQLPAAIAGGDSNEGYYAVAITQNTNQDFTATATPKSNEAQASDATNCASLTLNHLGTKTATGSASNCW
jgi:type IV pilus assembly protein PilE